MPLTLGNNKVAGPESCDPLPLRVAGRHADTEMYLCAQVTKEM